MDAVHIARINERALRHLIAAHATRLDEPLVLAIRYHHDAPDVHLLEVLDGFPDAPGETPFETEFAPSAELMLIGKLRLTLVSPTLLTSLITRGSPLVDALRADGTIEYYAAGAKPLIAELGLPTKASRFENQARRELLEAVGAAATPEEMAAIRKSWVS